MTSATAQSDTAVALSWTDVPGETGFLIQRSTYGGSTWATAGTVGAGVTSFTDTGLTEATSYSYRVTATNAVGNSAPSATQSVATLPSAPTGLTAAVVSGGQINLTWTDHSTAASYYYVEQSPNGSTGWTQVGSVSGLTATSYTATGPFNASTTYNFRVRGYSFAGVYSTYSPVASVMTAAYPSPPTLISATPQSDTAITLRWTDVAGETGFRVEQRYVASTSTWTAIGLVPAGVTTFTDTGLHEGSTFTYHVVATNASGDSAPSASLTATTLPAAPTGLSVSAVAWDQINLTWTDRSLLATTYYVEQSSSGTTWTQIGSISDPGAISYTATGPFNGSTTYEFRVHAYSLTGGNSAYATGSATTPAFPNQPTGLSATAASVSSINVSWSAVANETGYQVERSTNDTKWSIAGTVAANATSFLDTGLQEAKDYFYRILATNSAGNSAYSSTASSYPLPAAPQGLTATVTATRIDLAWVDQSGGAEPCAVEMSTSSTSGP